MFAFSTGISAAPPSTSILSFAPPLKSSVSNRKYNKEVAERLPSISQRRSLSRARTATGCGTACRHATSTAPCAFSSSRGGRTAPTRATLSCRLVPSALPCFGQLRLAIYFSSWMAVHLTVIEQNAPRAPFDWF